MAGKKGVKQAKGWARKHSCCLECHTKSRPHRAKGLCGRCYMRKNRATYIESTMRYRNSEKGKLARARRNKRYYKKKGLEYNRKYREEHREELNKKIRKRMAKHGTSYMARLSDNHNRRSMTRKTDISAKWLLRLKRKTKTCPLCEIKLKDKACYPDGKQLDHILPLSRRGLHVRSNVRYICARCNITRGNRSTT